jgi:hypothetical protein
MDTFSTLQKDGGGSAERMGLHKKKSGDIYEPGFSLQYQETWASHEKGEMSGGMGRWARIPGLPSQTA